MPVTVVVPTWRRPDLLQRCLEGVIAQDPAADEILVVARPDDAATLDVIEARAGSPGVRWVEVTEPGYVPPVRAGLAAATGDLVAFIDDDAVPEQGWLRALSAPFADHRVACVGGLVDTPGTVGVVHADAGRMRWYGKHIGNLGLVTADAPFEVDGVLEGNSMWRAEVLRDLEFLGAFAADDAPLYGLDLSLQAKSRGWKVVYTSDAAIRHTPGPRPGGSPDRSDRACAIRSYSRNMTLIGLRHMRGLARVAFATWWWLIGERASYGLVTALIDGSRGALARGYVTASFAGKADGMRAWLQTR